MSGQCCNIGKAERRTTRGEQRRDFINQAHNPLRSDEGQTFNFHILAPSCPVLFRLAMYLHSEIILYYNAVKSLIFGTASLFFGLSVNYIFARIAAAGGDFAAYLMFSEGYRQRAFFIWSRGFRAPVSQLVLWFTVVGLVASLYSTLIWSLDFPGYVLQTSNKSLAAFDRPFLDAPEYIVNLPINADTLEPLELDLARRLTANLIKPEKNLTLEAVSLGQPQVVNATQPDAGARIWLDEDGFSVSPDDLVWVMQTTNASGQIVPVKACAPKVLASPFVGWVWSCTFNNTSGLDQMGHTTSRPQVHWDDESDLVLDTRYIRPNRIDNIWASYSTGAGTAQMKQVFTVTKGNRRHTFSHLAFRTSLWTPPTSLFAASEIDDLLWRVSGRNDTERQQALPILSVVSRDIQLAQAEKNCFIYGYNLALDNTTVSQVTWEYLTVTSETDKMPIYSVLRYGVSAIELVRSETLPASRVPAPFNNESCPTTFMNVAYGGRVIGTDCRLAETDVDWAKSRNLSSRPRFFGQVDTSAVLIMTGLGDGQSNHSAVALDERVWQWVNSPAVAERIDSLLLARGFAVGVDATLVTVAETYPVAAASWLQLTLVLISPVLLMLSWALLSFTAGEEWSHTLQWNLVESLMKGESTSGKGWRRRLRGGDFTNPPEVTMTGTGDERELFIAERQVKWAEPRADGGADGETDGKRDGVNPDETPSDGSIPPNGSIV